MSKHTPGPWTAVRTKYRTLINTADGSPVAQCESLTDADMALVAAAPELLAALQALVADYERLLVESRITKRDRETMIDRLPHYTEAARAAIAKATQGGE